MARAVSRRPLTTEARVRSLAGIVDSNPARGMDVCAVFVV
jgi:hypothetical protein